MILLNFHWFLEGTSSVFSSHMTSTFCTQVHKQRDSFVISYTYLHDGVERLVHRSTNFTSITRVRLVGTTNRSSFIYSIITHISVIHSMF